jgi:hypothetical protein
MEEEVLKNQFINEFLEKYNKKDWNDIIIKVLKIGLLSIKKNIIKKDLYSLNDLDKLIQDLEKNNDNEENLNDENINKNEINIIKDSNKEIIEKIEEKKENIEEKSEGIEKENENQKEEKNDESEIDDYEKEFENEENEKEKENNIEPEIDDLLRKSYQKLEMAQSNIKKLNDNVIYNKNDTDDIIDTTSKKNIKEKKLVRENIDASLKK